MPKFSVKKPFTVLVGVVLVLVLGIVSLWNMPTDLLPGISLPYLMVVTAYPGASPERVENDVTRPLESSLGTVSGVENVSSTSSENYSTVLLEFAEDTDMDSAMVKASTAINQLADSLPEMAATPMLIEMSPDMLPTQYLAVDCEGMDIYALSAYAQQTVIPAIERVEGVASVSATGLVERSVEVTLRQDKIDTVNDRLLRSVNDALDEAARQLEALEGQFGESTLEQAAAALAQEKQDMANTISDALTNLDENLIPQLQRQIQDMEGEIAAWQSELESLQQQLENGLVPEVNIQELGIDEVMLQNVKAILKKYDPEYKAGDMPANLRQAVDEPAKRAAMQASIQRASAALEQALREELEDYPDVAAAERGLAEQLDALQDETDELRDQLAKLDDQITALQGDPALAKDEEKQARLEELKAQRSETERELIQREDEQRQLEKKQQTLRQMQDEQSQLATASLALGNAEGLVQGGQQAQAGLDQEIKEINARLEELVPRVEAARAQLQQLEQARGELLLMLQNTKDGIQGPELSAMATQLLFSGSEAQLQLGQMQLAQLESAREEYERSREQALANANLDQLLNMSTLAQILSAQNFSMPAGYIEDDGQTYLLKVGQAFESVEDISGTLLVSMEGLGDVYLRDVADIRVTDNADETYGKVGGNQAVLLAIYKGSTASTSEVSDACNAAAARLQEQNPDLRLTSIMDQGDYIRLIVDSVMSNLLWGAVLAIVVLALFLKDLRPTLVVAVSIPLSVLFAIVMMYFSDITLNMISLSGLALGIGMLVDNSIVVIENIYRLRARGVPAPRAAVQGARQVSGAIVASTATTVCVFLPLVFSDGLTRELMMDMALTIGYSLLASLAVALTVVPCAGSTLLRRTREIRHPLMDRVIRAYDAALRWCLRVKAVPLALSVALLAFSVWQVLHTGLELIPNISSNQISVTVRMPEDTAREDAFATADAVMERIMDVPGVDTVGAMSSAATGSLISGLGGGQDFSSFSYYVLTDTDAGRTQQQVRDDIEQATADLPCQVSTGSGSATDLSALTGSGVEVDIYGSDLDTLMEISEQVMEMMRQIPGIEDINNGQEEAQTEVRVVVDRDKAMRCGLTVAQIYAEISAALTTESTTTSLTVGADTYTVHIVDTTQTPDLDSLFAYEFTSTSADAAGGQTTQTHTLGEFASRLDAPGVASIARQNQSRYMTVSSSTAAGHNTTLLARVLSGRLQTLDLPQGYSVELSGESTQVQDMLVQMGGMLALALVLVYLVMVAQFQSLLSPFIVLFTIPLAFTGGMLGLLISGQTMSLMSLMGFLVLMGVVVNNGIVFVDYTNQLRLGGLDRHTALVAAGRTRMRPILMTTMTTVLAMVVMLFSHDPGSEIGRGMAIVIVGGLLYATLMTLFIVPVIYDILFKRPPQDIDVGDDGMDDLPDDAAEFAAQLGAQAPAAPDGAPPAAKPAGDEEPDLFPDYPIQGAHTKRRR